MKVVQLELADACMAAKNKGPDRRSIEALALLPCGDTDVQLISTRPMQLGSYPTAA
jgi:hypothetical protein